MISGWLIVDKPSGITSTQVGTIVKRLLGIKKLGHVGTLDPLATGVLVLALGDATKMIPYLEKTSDLLTEAKPLTKKYAFEIRWGIATDTLDSDGEILQRSDSFPTQTAIETVCLDLQGMQEQTPPMYSAIKVNGVRAYQLARQKKEFSINCRPVHIYSLELKQTINPTCSGFEVECSRGTYIRSLAETMAKKLGTLGHITQLRRLKDGEFGIQNAISLEKLRSLSHNCIVSEWIIPIGAVLGDIPAVSVLECHLDDIYHGRALALESSDPLFREACVVRILKDNQLLGIGYIQLGVCYPKRVFNNQIGEKDVDNQRKETIFN